MKAYIDYDKETGAILAVFDGRYPAPFEEFELPCNGEEFRLTEYKVVDHELVKIPAAETNQLYWNGVDPEIKKQKAEQKALLEEMKERLFLNLLSDEDAAKVPLLYDEFDPQKVYSKGERFVYKGELYKSPINSKIQNVLKLDKVTDILNNTTIRGLDNGIVDADLNHDSVDNISL